MADNVFVIGDVHGNLDRLEALLKQEGLLVWCKPCEGGGEWADGENCLNCDGLGWARARHDVTVIQLGDLGHWGDGGSPTGDLLCYKYVTENHWCDAVLWGNHDRAMVDARHAFTGFIPDYQTGHFLSILYQEGRLWTAIEAHNFLITHAGLAAGFKDQKVPDDLKTDLTAFVNWINSEDERYLGSTMDARKFDVTKIDKEALGIINAIGRKRGGMSAIGGILWRDIDESLYDGFRQIFGHSADPEHRVRMCSKNRTVRLDYNDGTHEKFADLVEVAFAADMKPSYCIDIGGKAKQGQAGRCLAGIWLPSEKVVEVRL